MEGAGGPTGVMNVGGGGGGARLMIAEGVALHDTCAGEATEECQDSEGGGGESYLPKRGRS